MHCLEKPPQAREIPRCHGVSENAPWATRYLLCTPPVQSDRLPAEWAPSGVPKSPVLWSVAEKGILGELLSDADWLLPSYIDPWKDTNTKRKNTDIKTHAGSTESLVKDILDAPFLQNQLATHEGQEQRAVHSNSLVAIVCSPHSGSYRTMH